MTLVLLWLILLLLSWPLAVLAVVVLPFLWLLSLPLRILVSAVEGLVRLIGALFLLPARLLGGGRLLRAGS